MRCWFSNLYHNISFVCQSIVVCIMYICNYFTGCPNGHPYVIGDVSSAQFTVI